MCQKSLRYTRGLLVGTLTLAACLSVLAQVVTPAYELSRWSGAAFALPPDAPHLTDRRTYSEEILGDEFLETISLPALDIGSGEHRPFPGTSIINGFSAILYATLEVRQAGCYEMSLNSDDGTILWLDDTLRLNNDGLHKMLLRRARYHLDARTYTAKLYYIDALPPLRGLEFALRRLDDASPCAKSRLTEPARVSLPAGALFASGSADLGPDAAASLEALCTRLRGLSFEKLTVTGHTDDVGSPGTNESLALRRAAAVVKHLRDCVDLADVKLAVTGAGAVAPIADNATEEGRALNRRVEVVVE